MKIKTSALIGAQLDWAVAKCEGHAGFDDFGPIMPYRVELRATTARGTLFEPSTDWAQGGPIIEREKITTSFNPDHEVWEADITNKAGDAFIVGHGPTLLIASMRCYVASKLGNEVEIPEELCSPT